MNVVITGASQGVGYSTALSFATDNTNTVFALSRNKAGLKRLVAESPGQIVPLECDISNDESVEKALKEIQSKCDSIEILINNAGNLVKNRLSELTIQDWRSVYEVNVFGSFRMCRELLPLLRKGMIGMEQKVRSHIVNISSMGGVQGSMKFEGLSAYSSSKGALIVMTECMSQELEAEGIRVNCVALGSVSTEMFSRAFPGVQAGSDPGKTGEFIRQFSSEGWRFFNGKTLPMTTSTP